MKRAGTVYFLGKGKESCVSFSPHERVWACNDWYASYPKVRPERVYQIHTQEKEWRLPGGRYEIWKKRCEKIKAQIVVRTDTGVKNQRFFDSTNAHIEMGKEFFGGTFSFMFYDAIKEGIAKIILKGFLLLQHGEYEWQTPAILMNIKIAREHGIDVQWIWENDRKSQLVSAVKIFGAAREVKMDYGDEGECVKKIDVVKSCGLENLKSITELNNETSD